MRVAKGRSLLRPPQERPERARAVAGLDLADHLQLGHIDDMKRVALPAGNDDALAVGRRIDAFGIVADIDALDRLEAREIEHADGAAILVRDEAPALRQRHRIGAYPDRHAAD